jgi:hypothetical protein
VSETIPALHFDAPADAPFPWLREMAATVRDQLLVGGAVLLHDLPLDGPDSLAEARAALGIAVHTPAEAFNNRSDFGNGILSPISWPDDRILCPFQESSFSQTFPSVVLTACISPPDGDGRAHLSDARRIADHLPAALAERVRRDGWTLTRAFHQGFGISWQEAFSVADRAELDELLTTAGIESEWLPSGSLLTVRRLPGVRTHPVTGEECWFNQLAFLNVGSLDPTERRIMIRSFGEHLPMNTFFGDGSPLSDEELAAVQQAYDAVRIEVPWQRGDLLITDNLMTAQGRSPYDGPAEFLITLGTHGEKEYRS